LFEVADKDKDGTVTFEEFKVWHNEHKAQQEARIAASKAQVAAGASESDNSNAARRKMVEDMQAKKALADAAPELSQDDRLEKLIKTFKALDRSGGGSVTPVDFAAAVEEIDKVSQLDALKAFK
jgi:Ca2+-binding EF-hand superfamily protein